MFAKCVACGLTAKFAVKEGIIRFANFQRNYHTFKHHEKAIKNYECIRGVVVLKKKK